MPSFLLTDFGIANTRTLLIDVVEGQHRLIIGAMNRTTTAPPLADATVALERNLTQMSALTGRTYISEQGFHDSFVATASSVGRPLRAMLLGLMEPSIQSARRALAGTYIEVVDTLTYAQEQSEEARVNAIVQQRPDLILIVGGTNSGNDAQVRALVQLVEIAVSIMGDNPQERPFVLYAGNDTLQAWVESRLKPRVSLALADNVRPSLEREELASARRSLARIFDGFLKRQPGGFKEVSEVSKTGIIPTAQSATHIVRYLETRFPDGVLYVDVGSGSSMALSSREGHSSATIHSTLGVGHSIENALQELDWRDIARWLPFPFSLEKLEEWVYNKALAPRSIPQSLSDLFIERAIAREIVRKLLADAQGGQAPSPALADYSPVILSGAVFTANLPPGLAALIALDAIQPAGIIELWQDPYALAPGLGAVSQVDPKAVVQVIDNGGFVRLGRVYAPTGNLGRGKMQIRLSLPNGRSMTQELAAGDIWVPSLMPNIEVEVEVKVPRGMALNGKRRWVQRLRTGAAGVIFDMRGRPLRFAAGEKGRQQIGAWFTAVTGIRLDDSIYEDMPEEMQHSSLEEMAAGISLEMPPDLTFPDLQQLPDSAPPSRFRSLLEEEAADDSASDLAKELGLR